MNINNKNWETIWLEKNNKSIGVIDQTKLPYSFETLKLQSCSDAVEAIKKMVVRGAPLIGVTGAYAFALGVLEDSSDSAINNHLKTIQLARPTAINLKWSTDRVYKKIYNLPYKERYEVALQEAENIKAEDIKMCSLIGDYGLEIIEEISKRKNNKTVNILTHCNAGWLATIDWGTALSPIYKAKRAGIDLHVWVDETRPRNQGASLTAFELASECVPYTVIVDNTGGYLMQNGEVDLVIVGSDRTTRTGDVCNKIGTYLKALSAKDNQIPFYAALPFSTIDWEISDGSSDIPIEIRSEKEVSEISGIDSDGKINAIRLVPENTKCFNPGFDVTPSRLVTGLITEKGISEANEISLREMYEKN